MDDMYFTLVFPRSQIDELKRRVYEINSILCRFSESGKIDWKRTDFFRKEEMSHLGRLDGLSYFFDDNTHQVKIAGLSDGTGEGRQRRAYRPFTQRQIRRALFSKIDPCLRER